MNRHKTFIIDEVKKYNFLDTAFYELRGGDYEKPFEVLPTTGSHSLETCEPCRKQRQLLIQDLSEDLQKFPNCCIQHRKLLELNVFDINDFKDAPTMIADKVMFSYHHVINNLDNDDWFEDIADYFEYIFESFGSMPYDYGEPYKWSTYKSCLTSLLHSVEDKITSDKISKIDIKTRINKVLLLIEPVQKDNETEKKDLNLLLSKYEEWYKIFPFELPYFSHLKEKYSRTLPLFTGRTRYNKYLKTTTRECHTKDSLTSALLDITINIISNINGLTLYQNKQISDAEKHKIGLLTSSRKLELYELSLMPTKTQVEYIKVLKQWFKGEKKFITEITPLLKEYKSNKEKSAPELSIKQIALKLVYEGILVNRSNAKEIVKDYGHTSGDKLFQEFTYFSSLANRKGNPSPATNKKFQNKIELFESVIELLSEANKQRALDELGMLKINRDNLFE